jgi:hypothetical protein
VPRRRPDGAAPLTGGRTRQAASRTRPLSLARVESLTQEAWGRGDAPPREGCTDRRSTRASMLVVSRPALPGLPHLRPRDLLLCRGAVPKVRPISSDQVHRLTQRRAREGSGTLGGQELSAAPVLAAPSSRGLAQARVTERAVQASKSVRAPQPPPPDSMVPLPGGARGGAAPSSRAAAATKSTRWRRRRARGGRGPAALARLTQRSSEQPPVDSPSSRVSGRTSRNVLPQDRQR